MPRMPAAERRKKLIEAAQRVIARDGVAAATTRAIAAEAQMPLASFHYVFESQQELMRELILSLADIQADVLASSELVDDPIDSVRHLLDRLLDYVVANKGAELAAYEIDHYALRTPGLESLASVRVESARRLVRQAMAVMEDRHGPFAADADDIAHLVLVVADGIITVFLSDGDEAAARRSIELLAPQIDALGFGRGVA